MIETMVTEGVKAGSGIAAKAAPVAKAAAAQASGIAPAVKTVTASVFSGAKAVLLLPIFGVAAIGGIIAYEMWKGGKDAREFKAAIKG